GTNYTKIGSSSTTNYADNTAAVNTAYLYAVKSIDGTNAASALSSPDLATTVIFSDPTLTAGMPVKAVHVTQLRTAVNAVRTLAGSGAYSYTDAVITAGSTRAKAIHITDLRTALIAARATLGLPALTFTDSTLTGGVTVIKAAHIVD